LIVSELPAVLAYRPRITTEQTDHFLYEPNIHARRRAQGRAIWEMVRGDPCDPWSLTARRASQQWEGYWRRTPIARRLLDERRITDGRRAAPWRRDDDRRACEIVLSIRPFEPWMGPRRFWLLRDIYDLLKRPLKWTSDRYPSQGSRAIIANALGARRRLSLISLLACVALLHGSRLLS
jgi:hypothetical protein